MSADSLVRCAWSMKGDEPDRHYHDTEWGVPVHDDQRLFEFLILEGAQAGLSWSTVLKKRDGYRKAFAEFDPAKVASFTPAKQAKLLENAGIIRNKLKVAAAITNAQAFLETADEFGSFDTYLWRFVDGKPKLNKWRTTKQVPASTAISDALSKDLQQRGFKFVGSTIMYAFMQAVGMVNDHTCDCFRWAEVQHG